ncbi:MAG: PAS domain-containing protein [Proteobacteria bacterium]|nr:PAS domain-containing protein [Pseudomonadota bacterium]
MPSPNETNSDYFLTVFNAIPAPAFTVDDDVRIQKFNRAAAALLGAFDRVILDKRSGEVLHCLHSTETPDGCGHADDCGKCVIRNSVNEAVRGGGVWRQPTSVDWIAGQVVVERDLLVTASPFRHQDRDQVLLILEDVTEQKRAEAARLDQERLRGVIEMAGAAAHELSQPLQVMLGAAYSLKEIELPDESGREAVDEINQSVKRCGEVVRKIQRVTRYESKPYVGDMKIIDLDKASD